jgi:hypothetical protein
MQSTVWSNLQVAHPADWALALLSPPGPRGRLSFVDRYVQRMDVHYRPLARPIDPNLVISQHRPRKSGRVKARDLKRCPPLWAGLELRDESGLTVHAARCFAEARMMVEVTILWPDKPTRALPRNRALEEQILTRLEPLDDSALARTWRAFGLDVRMPRPLTLTDWRAQAGLVRFDFEPPRWQSPDISIHRYALPETIGDDLEAWLRRQLPRRAEVRAVRPWSCNTHPAAEIISAEPHIAPLLRKLVAPWMLRDMAWICPDSQRLYHLRLQARQRSEELPLPAGLAVHCCSAAGAVS